MDLTQNNEQKHNEFEDFLKKFKENVRIQYFPQNKLIAKPKKIPKLKPINEQSFMQPTQSALLKYAVNQPIDKKSSTVNSAKISVKKSPVHQIDKIKKQCEEVAERKIHLQAFDSYINDNLMDLLAKQAQKSEKSKMNKSAVIIKNKENVNLTQKYIL